MKHSIKREQSHARMSFAECENVRATLKHMKLSFHLILTLALWLMAAQGAWATDPVTKRYAFSTRSLENNNSTLKMTDPDDNTSKTIITSASNYKFSNYGSELRVGAGGQYTIYPNVNGKVTRVEFTRMGRWGSPYYPDPSQPVSYIGAFSMSITGMTCNGKNSLTGNGTSVGEGLSAYTNENASFTFVSTDADSHERTVDFAEGVTLCSNEVADVVDSLERVVELDTSIGTIHALKVLDRSSDVDVRSQVFSFKLGNLSSFRELHDNFVLRLTELSGHHEEEQKHEHDIGKGTRGNAGNVLFAI